MVSAFHVTASSQIDSRPQTVESISDLAREKRNARLLGWVIYGQFSQLSDPGIDLSHRVLIGLEVRIQSCDDIAPLPCLSVFQRGKSYFEFVDDLICVPDQLVVVDQSARRAIRE